MPDLREMPMLVPENKSYKIDASGRIVIPSHLRIKFDWKEGDMMAYFTTLIDGVYYFCATFDPVATEIEREKETAKEAAKAKAKAKTKAKAKGDGK